MAKSLVSCFFDSRCSGVYECVTHSGFGAEHVSIRSPPLMPISISHAHRSAPNFMPCSLARTTNMKISKQLVTQSQRRPGPHCWNERKKCYWRLRWYGKLSTMKLNTGSRHVILWGRPDVTVSDVGPDEVRRRPVISYHIISEIYSAPITKRT